MLMNISGNTDSFLNTETVKHTEFNDFLFLFMFNTIMSLFLVYYTR